MDTSSSNNRPAGAPGLDFIETVSAALTDLIELAQSLPVPADQSEQTAKILDRLGEELAEAAAMVRALPGQPREAAGYTFAAASAVATAAASEHDFGGWLAVILCQAAARLGSSAALVMGRSGSWEAKAVLTLVKGTAGYGEDEDLSRFKDGAPQ